MCDRRFPWVAWAHPTARTKLPSLLRGGGLPKRERERRLLARARSPATHCHNAMLRSLAVRLTISRVNLRIRGFLIRVVRAWRRTGCSPALLASVQPTGHSRRVRYRYGTRHAPRALHDEQPSHPPPTGVGSFQGNQSHGGPRWKSGRILRRVLLRRVERGFCSDECECAARSPQGGPQHKAQAYAQASALPLARQTDRPESVHHQITRCVQL